MKLRFILLNSIIFAFSHSAWCQGNLVLLLTCDGVNQDRGNIMVAVFNSEKTFLSDDIYRPLVQKVSSKGRIAIKIELPAGKYAVAVYHDENANGKLDRNIFYYPTEPFGFSRNARSSTGPPSWNDAAFTLEGSMEMAIRLK